jgi:uncharacterized repeat protein (TIGR03803 family)
MESDRHAWPWHWPVSWLRHILFQYFPSIKIKTIDEKSMRKIDNFRKSFGRLLILFSVAALSACGGGGGSGSTPGTSTSPTDPVSGPTITTDVQSTSVSAGKDATFSVVAGGTALSYQWQSSLDGVSWSNIDNANAATLTLAAAPLSENGERVRVIVSNSAGSVTSSIGVLSVSAGSIVVSNCGPGSATGTLDSESTVYSFQESGVTLPTTSLLAASDCNLYGLAAGGLIYTAVLGNDGGPFTVSLFNASFNPSLYSFGGGSSFIQASDGSLYGMSDIGGAQGTGSVIKVVLGAGGAPGTASNVYSFGTGADGAYAAGGLIQASDGNLYGVTAGGIPKSGVSGDRFGTVVEVMPGMGGAPATESVLHFFQGQGFGDGGTPTGSLVQASNGKLYGMTAIGGAGDVGGIFEVVPGVGGAGATVSMVDSFAVGSNLGYTPTGTLVQARDGNLYGMTTAGGANNFGTVFKFVPGIGSVPATGSLVYSFGAVGSGDAGGPTGSLMQASDGNLYGVTAGGGVNGTGTVFKIVLGVGGASATETVLHSFGVVGSGDGFLPVGPLIQAADGNLYGVTSAGGANSFGSIFRIH